MDISTQWKHKPNSATVVGGSVTTMRTIHACEHFFSMQPSHKSVKRHARVKHANILYANYKSDITQKFTKLILFTCLCVSHFLKSSKPFQL